MKIFSKTVFGILLSMAIVIAFLGVITITVTGGNLQEESFEQRRERVLSELQLAIEKAKDEGKYECCIEPDCTMCYLGNFIWENGECHCDDLIKEGKDPCPQCAHGRCEGEEEFCEINIK